jgi:hypothetical protein
MFGDPPSVPPVLAPAGLPLAPAPPPAPAGLFGLTLVCVVPPLAGDASSSSLEHAPSATPRARMVIE